MAAVYAYATGVEPTKAMGHRLTCQGDSARLGRYHYPAALVSSTHPAIVRA